MDALLPVVTDGSVTLDVAVFLVQTDPVPQLTVCLVGVLLMVRPVVIAIITGYVDSYLSEVVKMDALLPLVTVGSVTLGVDVVLVQTDPVPQLTVGLVGVLLMVRSVAIVMITGSVVSYLSEVE